MTTGPFSLRNVELAPWQRDAVEAWVRGDGTAYRGTLEIFTGGGKTLIALACMEQADASRPGLRVAIVVPTEALAQQWIEVLLARTHLKRDEIGLMGAGGRDAFQSLNHGHRVLVAVLNSAAKKLPSSDVDPATTMLIVDECHRAGAPKFSKVLDTRAAFRLGLSATPDREELDDDGEPLSYDEQVVGRKLGGVVYRWMLKDARASGWLPSFRIEHHGVLLGSGERAEYEVLSRRVDEAADRLREFGFDSGRAQHLRGRDGALGDAARTYVAATSARKDLLYRASERHRLAVRLVSELLTKDPRRRIILFHERIDAAIALHGLLTENLAAGADAPLARLALEHSRMNDRGRRESLDRFRSGEANVLVSVKSLVEGIDVPSADVGISVASSSSVRQRIQSLGRVLRRQFNDPDSKRAEMHVIYAADTVDEVIYGKQDWSDITGDGTNSFWKWSLDEPSERTEMPGPPRTPRPTEDQEWERLGQVAPVTPEPWLGELVGQEYSVDTTGTVTNQAKAIMRNPQNVGRLIEQFRGKPGGRFRVTPMHRLILVWNDEGEGNRPYAIGRLTEPFETLVSMGDEFAPKGPKPERPGDPMPALPDREHGTFALRQKRGGVIERKVKGGVEWALVDDAEHPELALNAQRILDSWPLARMGSTGFKVGMPFFVSSDDDAWYVEAGVPRFLVQVPGGFSWPA